MNWDAIAAIAELLGATGVIVTLAYLAIQIRHSSTQLERNIEASRVVADDAVVRSFNEWRALMIADERGSDIYLRGLQDSGSLTEEERLRFNFIMTTFIWIAWQMWRSEELLGTPNLQIFRHMFRHPGGRDWYQGHRNYFPDDFRSMLDGVRIELDGEGAEFLGPEDSSSMFSGVLRDKNTSV